jgi:signal transduction histidine kinase
MAVAALVLLIVGVATAPLARRISRPVERLTEASRRFGAGELSYRVPERRRHRRHHHDELGQLTRAWNEMAERVEKLVRGQKELLANVSHELRSPLARIRVALELVPRNAAAEVRLRDIEQDLTELDRLIEDVLAASRLDAAGLPAHLGLVEARGLLGQIAERAAHDPVCAGKAVQVRAGPPIELHADAALLKRALWNLVENAAKYGTPPIVLATERTGDRAKFSVSDEGPGIPAAERERVFEPFWRGDRAHTPGVRAGCGLGLTLARRIAEAHGGSIAMSAAHEDGGERGLRVVLEIPLHEPLPSDERPSHGGRTIEGEGG